jgi:D-arabinose 1-dehydrogenase-like Zn-dependent alcohol dehydrogenase
LMLTASAYHAINGCELKHQQWVAVIGCGGLGHLGTIHLRTKGTSMYKLTINSQPFNTRKP